MSRRRFEQHSRARPTLRALPVAMATSSGGSRRIPCRGVRQPARARSASSQRIPGRTCPCRYLMFPVRFLALRPLEHSKAICVPYSAARFQSIACICDNARTLPMVGTNCPMTPNPVAFSRHRWGPCDQPVDLGRLMLSLNHDSIDANATKPAEGRATVPAGIASPAVARGRVSVRR